MNRLGRGLSTILEDVEESYIKDIAKNSDLVKEVNLSLIDPNPFQPRKVFNDESLHELADSIKRQGLLQPVLLIEADNRFMLIAGERRVRASRIIGLEKIKAIIVDYDIKKLREYAIIENIQREDLNVLDLAVSLKELLEEYGFTHNDLAKLLSKSRSYITNLLRVLTLGEYTKNALKEGKISLGHAKVMVHLEEQKQKEIAEKIIKEELSVRETEKLLKKPEKRTREREQTYKREIALLGSEIKKRYDLNISASNDYVKIMIKNREDLEKIEGIFDLR